MESAAPESAAPESPSRFPEWCGPPQHWAQVYACEQVVASPVWHAVLVADVVGLWLIAAILLREREQARELARRRAALPRALRVRRLWRTLGAAARLAAMEAPRRPPMEWGKAWDAVAAARANRRHFLKRRNFNLVGVFVRAAGPCLVAAVLLVVAFEVDAFYSVGLPGLRLGPGAESAVGGAWALIVLRLLLDYACVSLTDPGRPGADAQAGAEAGDVELELGFAAAKDAARWCRLCDAARPPRSHHCKVCRRCCLKMDHHCPFVNNCVGLRNYRRFCLFLVDVQVACLGVALSLAPQVPAIVWRTATGTWPHQLRVVAAFVLPAVFIVLLAPFFAFHLQLLLLDETTLERMGRHRALRRQGGGRGRPRESAPPDGGRGALENFSEVCGAPPACCGRPLEAFLRLVLPPTAAKLAKRSA